MRISEARKRQFKETVWKFYKESGRHDLPWRKTKDPYKILVSEVMLQQTQIPRVIEKYKLFLKTFPNIHALAEAPVSSVLSLWSGLGYNRRAKFLRAAAQYIDTELKGKFPKSIEDIEELPGVGPYSARAVAAFAYNTPSSFLETNIRTVYITHFYTENDRVHDRELMELVNETTDTKNPREWYWALMDYGSHLKSQGNRSHRQSKTYMKQGTFKGSRRQLRGKIVKELLQGKKTILGLGKKLEKKKEEILPALNDLIKEGMIKREGDTYCISS